MVDYIEEVCGLLDFARDQIAKAEEEVKRWKAGLRLAALDKLKNCPNEDERLELAAQLYWHYTEVSSDSIRDVLGITRGQVRSYLPKIWVDISCKGCDCAMETVPDSRSELLELKRGKHNIYCDDCEAKQAARSAEYKKKRESEQAEQRAALNHLKTMPYPQYLKSEHWQDLRRRMLKRASFACQLCNSKGRLNVHHRTYERRGQEPYSDLIVLCENCHSKFHDKLESVG